MTVTSPAARAWCWRRTARPSSRAGRSKGRRERRRGPRGARPRPRPHRRRGGEERAVRRGGRPGPLRGLPLHREPLPGRLRRRPLPVLLRRCAVEGTEQDLLRDDEAEVRAEDCRVEGVAEPLLTSLPGACAEPVRTRRPPSRARPRAAGAPTARSRTPGRPRSGSPNSTRSWTAWSAWTASSAMC
ncbi:hypothetical protein NKH18_50580 [Streptomyces sp. M10(2022)]